MSAPDVIPLFPLNTVLFPGVPLPLHVFEYRYRTLFDEQPRRVGIIAIRQGLEVGEEEQPVLHEVGCVGEVRNATRFADGRYDVVTVGGPRFRLLDLDDSQPYLRASVEYLPEETGETADALALQVVAGFTDYWLAVAEARGESTDPPIVPVEDPVLVSYVVAAAMRLDLPEKQALLAIPDAPARLRRVEYLLRRETALVSATPDDVPTEGPFSLN